MNNHLKMSERNLHTTKNRLTFRVGSQNYGLYSVPIPIEHFGKNQHLLHLEFVVDQTEDSNNDVNLYIMNQENYFDWMNLIVPRERQQGKNNQPRQADRAILRSKGERLDLEIRGSGMAYLIFNNRFSSFTRKNIVLEYWESWEETIPEEDVLFTIPPDDESLKQEIERMIDESQETLMIISPYCDMTIINRLVSARDAGVDVKIILRNEQNLTGLAKDGLVQIQKNFPNEHKLIKNVHSRIIICDSKEAIVSSADLDQKSLQGMLNIGMKTSDIELVKKIIAFFGYVWKSN